MFDTPATKRRWYRLTPDRVILALLALEGFFLLSERFRWFAFNQWKGWTVLIAVASAGLALLLMLLWFAASLLFRWRFQFSIRSLLLLVVVVAVPCSWLGVKTKQARRQVQTVEKIVGLGGSMRYDYESSAPFAAQAEPPYPDWLRRLLGDEFFADVAGVRVANDMQVTDVGLAHLKRLLQLHWLYLYDTQTTDAGVKKLRQALPNCRVFR
jgi:hypothetical protein